MKVVQMPRGPDTPLARTLRCKQSLHLAHRRVGLRRRSTVVLAGHGPRRGGDIPQSHGGVVPDRLK